MNKKWNGSLGIYDVVCKKTSIFWARISHEGNKNLHTNMGKNTSWKEDTHMSEKEMRGLRRRRKLE